MTRNLIEHKEEISRVCYSLLMNLVKKVLECLPPLITTITNKSLVFQKVDKNLLENSWSYKGSW